MHSTKNQSWWSAIIIWKLSLLGRPNSRSHPHNPHPLSHRSYNGLRRLRLSLHSLMQFCDFRTDKCVLVVSFRSRSIAFFLDDVIIFLEVASGLYPSEFLLRLIQFLPNVYSCITENILIPWVKQSDAGSRQISRSLNKDFIWLSCYDSQMWWSSKWVTKDLSEAPNQNPLPPMLSPQFGIVNQECTDDWKPIEFQFPKRNVLIPTESL